MTRSFAQSTPIGTLRTGKAVSLTVLDQQTARVLAAAYASMDPWVRLGFDSERLLSVMTSSANSTTGFCICIDGEPAGAMVTRDGWLLGPYLAILAVSPRYQGLGAGYAALRWFERDAIGKGARNLWLTAASFNLRALAAYERCGFVRVGHLQGLLAEGLDEVLMRKQLAPSPKPPAV